ncbi:unnamed protein product, partial [Phaeothamnion confervicola]
PIFPVFPCRFKQDKIYTNVADVLISVNPYKKIPLLYEIPLYQMQDHSDEDLHSPKLVSFPLPPAHPPRCASDDPQTGETAWQDDEAPRDRRPAALKSKLSKPHVHSVADRAFRYMTEPGREYAHGKLRSQNQSVIITGESGAGKTEASKYVMRYLITASQILGGASSSGGGSDDGSVDALAKRIEDVLLQSNTVLEAFGNAKTVRNDNSSRFGKYIKLQYDGAFRLVGAKTEHFLLEKSRLVKVDANERSYHIFYQLCAGLPSAQRAALGLGPATAFHSIAQGNCVDLGEDVSDAVEFARTNGALGTLGFATESKQAVYRMLAALLHLGNVRFEDVEDEAAAAATAAAMAAAASPEGSELARTSLQNKCRMLISMAALAAQLGLKEEALANRVVRRAMVTARQSFHEIPLNADQSRDNLLGLCKHVYGQLFAYIVWKINHASANGNGAANGNGPNGYGYGGSSSERVRAFIGILDIFGFEIMQTNSFEQLCINYANEVLQRQFNHHIFVLEQAEYAVEGLDVASIPFRDNQPIIDLVAKRPSGLMIILEDQVLTGRKAYAANKMDDRHLLGLYHQAHHRHVPHPNYQKPRLECDQFILRHFAGSVTYDIDGFLEKNNDSLQDDLVGLALNSTSPLLQVLIRGGGVAVSSSNGSVSVGISGGGVIGNTALGALGGGVYPAFAAVAAELTLQAGNNTRETPSGTVAATAAGNGGGGSSRCASAAEMAAQGGMARRASQSVSGAAGLPRMAAASTVSSTFRRQLDQLVEQLGATEPHYIKCIKPNAAKTAGGWSSPLVIQQLRYSGVLEVVRIRREAFPTRIAFQELNRRFGDLISWRFRRPTPPDTAAEEEAKAASLLICQRVLEAKDFQLGHHKVFLRDDGIERLRAALRQHYHGLAARLQAMRRGVLARRELAAQKARAVMLQRVARMHMARRLYGRKRAAAEVLQACWRGSVERRRYLRDRAAAVAMQAAVRGLLERRAFHAAERRRKAVTRIQSNWRSSAQRRKFQELRAAAITVQAHTRARRATKAFRKGRRSRLALVHYRTARAAITAIQAGERMRASRLRFRRIVARATMVQAMARRFLCCRAHRRAVRAVRRLQRALRAFLRNLKLMRAVTALFASVEAGDSDAVTSRIAAWPELLFVRMRWDAGSSYRTLVHSACFSGRMDMVALLEPFPEDVRAVERLRNSCLHYAASAANYSMIKYLAKRVNMDVERALRPAVSPSPSLSPSPMPSAMAPMAPLQGSREEAAANIASQRLAHARMRRDMSAMKLRVNSGTGGTAGGKSPGAGSRNSVPSSRHLMEGFLKKRRETDRFLKRWCALKEFVPATNEDGTAGGGPALCYYHKRGDRQAAKVIPLGSCMLKKSMGVNYAFELHSPMLLDPRNREGRLYFQASSEEELQQWMVPLRILVRFYQFRHDKRDEPMEFVNLASRASLVQARNRNGETALHAAVNPSICGPPGSAAAAAATAGGCSGGGDSGGGGSSPRALGARSTVGVQQVVAWVVDNG